MSKKTAPSLIGPIIMQASRAQIAAMMARFAARGFDGVTPALAMVVHLLDTIGVRSTVLAQQTGVTKQAMSQLVRLLKERGYVEQAPDAKDSRAKVIRLTKRGVALQKSCVKVREELNAAAIEVLGKKGLERLRADLGKVIASFAMAHKSENG
jgi:DNA-binding MarR family transcriptional regulator